MRCRVTPENRPKEDRSVKKAHFVTELFCNRYGSRVFTNFYARGSQKKRFVKNGTRLSVPVQFYKLFIGADTLNGGKFFDRIISRSSRRP
jgi:hypothetical protein